MKHYLLTMTLVICGLTSSNAQRSTAIAVENVDRIDCDVYTLYRFVDNNLKIIKEGVDCSWGIDWESYGGDVHYSGDCEYIITPKASSEQYMYLIDQRDTLCFILLEPVVSLCVGNFGCKSYSRDKKSLKIELITAHENVTITKVQYSYEVIISGELVLRGESDSMILPDSVQNLSDKFKEGDSIKLLDIKILINDSGRVMIDKVTNYYARHIFHP
jgi:hypothetical protein